MRWVEPHLLISASRLDIFARTEFVRSRISGRGESWARDLYKNFLSINGIDGSEAENNLKSTTQDYLRSFESLIDSMQGLGFDETKGCIPLSSRGICNGGHRFAAALELGIAIAVEDVREPFGSYNYRWFDRRKMDTVYVEAMALELLSRSANARAILVFGHSSALVDSIEEKIESTAEVVIRRRVQLTEIGKRRIVKLAYDHNEWWDENRIEQMTAERFTSGMSHCDVFFTLEQNLERIQSRKTELREKLPDRSFEREINGTDHYFDTIILAETLLNRNSVNFLNSSPVGSENRIMNMIGGPKFTHEPSSVLRDWCIDGSAVLEIHGLRRANDIDYITEKGAKIPKYLSKTGDNHNDEYIYSQLSIDEILRDPRLHMTYKGVKFLAIPTLLSKKFESKDENMVQDIQMILDLSELNQKIYASRESHVKSKIQLISFEATKLIDRSLRKLPTGLEQSTRRMIRTIKTKLVYFFK